MHRNNWHSFNIEGAGSMTKPFSDFYSINPSFNPLPRMYSCKILN